MTECRPAEIGRVLGFDEVEVDHLGHGHVKPPAGARSVSISGGEVAHVEVRLERQVLDRGALDARFGEGRPVPRVDYDRPFMLAYDVTVDGAPARCTVFAHFPDEPLTPRVEATELTLRLDPCTVVFRSAPAGSPPARHKTKGVPWARRSTTR